MAKKIEKKKKVVKKLKQQKKAKVKKETKLKKKKPVVKPKKKLAVKPKKKAAPKKITVKKKVSKIKKQKAAPKPKVEKEKKSKLEKTAIPETIAAPVQEAPVQPKPRTIEDIKGYSKKDLEHFRQIILEKRDEILEQLQNLREQMLDPTTGEYINENSPYSLHMAEQGTDAMEREKTFLYAQRENKFLGYLEDALKRIDAGTYGICIECVEEPQNLCETCPLIPKARLEAVPHSQLCLPIKQRQEKNR